ncbi:hypothetical protein Tco_1224434 [Tanacetum coccineum]
MEVTTQAAQIKDLKAQIKQLKKKAKPVISHHNAWIKSVSMKKRLARKKYLKTKLMQKESVSKQGRKPAKSEPTVDKDLDFDDLDDAIDYMETEDAHDEGTVKDSEEISVSTEDQVSTDKLKVSTDKPNEGTAEPNEGTTEPKDGNSDESAAPTTVFRDDETIAQFLVTMSQNKTKQKGFEIKEIKDTDRPRTTTERSILTLKPLLKIDPKDKGKKVLEEKAKSDAESEGVNEAERKFAQLANDEEIARKVQEEWEAEEEKKKLAEEEATKAALIRDYDDIQARIEADSILAARLQEEEREKFTIEERAKLLHDTIAAQRRFLTQQRAAKIRSRPPIRTQLRNQMMTYLKHVGGKKHSDLKNKIFEEIQILYEKVKSSDENFVAIGSAKDERIIRELNKKAAGTKKADSIKEESKEEAGTRKRKLGTRKKIKSRKRRFRHGTSEDEKENDELKLCLTIAPDEDKEVDYEILDRKYPIIEWKTEYLGIKPQFDETKGLEESNLNVVIRSNGQRRYFSTLMRVLSIFDREDLNVVYKLMMDIYKNKVPEGFDRVLWGDLMIMFNPNDEDEFWNTQQDWNVSWIFYENCGVYVLRLEDGTEINILAERKYPLTKNTLQRMMDLEAKMEVRRIFEFQKQTAFGKDKSNPLIVDSLLKTIKLSIHLVVYNRELAIPEQTTTEEKLKENQGCRVDTDQVHQNGDLKNRSVWIHPPGLQDVTLKKHEVKQVQQSCLGEDYHNLWDVIVIGDLEEEPTLTGETSAPPTPKTAKQLAAKRNQERVKSILLLAIPDEYLLKFHNVADAKSLWEAIKSRFGGNEESKKM